MNCRINFLLQFMCCCVLLCFTRILKVGENTNQNGFISVVILFVGAQNMYKAPVHCSQVVKDS